MKVLSCTLLQQVGEMMMGYNLSDVIAAEEALARKEEDSLGLAVEMLPDGPLKEKAKEARGSGDLAGLPEGHPLRIALESARVRYEDHLEREKARENVSSEREVETSAAERSRARRAKRRENRIREEDNSRRFSSVVSSYNSELEALGSSLARLKGKIGGVQTELDGNLYARQKLARTERMILAVERGIFESKLNVRRVTNG